MDFFDNELKDLKKRIKWDFKDLEEEHVATPLVSVKESADSVLVKIVLPDVARKDISLKVSENSLEVRARKKVATEVKQKHYHKVDTQLLNYYRELDLPCPVDHRKAKVDFANGLLKITVPKIKRKFIVKLKK